MAGSGKRVFSPAFTGLSCTALLIVSRLLSQYTSLAPDIDALNTVLRIIAMCECVHLVRVTSALTYSHVWDSGEGVVLFAMPVVNLLVTAVQLFTGGGSLSSNLMFTAILTLFSLPAFFCYYFAFYLRIAGNKSRRGIKSVLRFAGIAYTVIRILDKSLFPFISSQTGISIPSTFLKIVSYSSSLSFMMFVAAAVGFVLIAVTYGRRSVHR